MRRVQRDPFTLTLASPTASTPSLPPRLEAKLRHVVGSRLGFTFDDIDQRNRSARVVDLYRQLRQWEASFVDDNQIASCRAELATLEARTQSMQDIRKQRHVVTLFTILFNETSPVVSSTNDEPLVVADAFLRLLDIYVVNDIPIDVQNVGRLCLLAARMNRASFIAMVFQECPGHVDQLLSIEQPRSLLDQAIVSKSIDVVRFLLSPAVGAHDRRLTIRMNRHADDLASSHMSAYVMGAVDNEDRYLMAWCFERRHYNIFREVLRFWQRRSVTNRWLGIVRTLVYIYRSHRAAIGVDNCESIEYNLLTDVYDGLVRSVVFGGAIDGETYREWTRSCETIEKVSTERTARMRGFVARVLPIDDLLQIVCDYVFMPFSSLGCPTKKRQRMTEVQ